MVTTPRLTYQDYADLEGDERYELLDGELVMAPAPNMDHQEVVTNLGHLLVTLVKEHDLGTVYYAPTDVVLSDTDVVQPDILFVSKERSHIRTADNIQGAPDLIVEILSPSSVRRDWHDKRELYAVHEVREYWIVDPVHQIVSVMLLHDGVLEIAEAHTEGDTLTSTILEGFSASLDEIF